MDFLDWCSLVLKKLIEAGRSPYLDEIRLAQLLYGEEFRTSGDFHHSTHRHGMLDAIAELVNVGLVEERSRGFWTVTPDGRQFADNPAPLLRQMRAVALEADEKRILGVVNTLSPQVGLDPPHAWLEWVQREPLLAEYGITAGFEMQEILWPVSEDLERRGLVYRKASPGWHLDLKPTYSGLAWERRPVPISEPEMGHVLFLDIVGYSKLPMAQQAETLEQLNEIVRSTGTYAQASENGSLIKLPTGDGMALVFFSGLTSHIRCAIEIGHALKTYPHLKLRMGLHSGPVHRISDINDSRNVAGGGINMAQRVMDCGDAEHILLSKAVADTLQQLGGWEDKLQDLGEVEVKHGIKIHVYSFIDDELGNQMIPVKVRAQRVPPSVAPIPIPVRDPRDDSLSAEEIELLIAAADNGEISLLSSDETGSWVRAGNRDFADQSDRVLAAMYVQALKSLSRRELVTHAGGVAYDLTGNGFHHARELKQRERATPTLVPEVDSHMVKADNGIGVDFYDFRVRLRNDSSSTVREFRVEVEIPKEFLQYSGATYTMEVQNHNRPGVRLFRATEKHWPGTVIYPDSLSDFQILLEYQIRVERYTNITKNEVIRVKVFADDDRVNVTDYVIAEYLSEDRCNQLWAPGRERPQALRHPRKFFPQRQPS